MGPSSRHESGMTMPSPQVLSAQHLHIHRGKYELCRDLSFTLNAGECLVILGRNGAGKTSLLNTLAGLCAPSSGEVYLHGRPLTRWSLRDLAQQRSVLIADQHDAFTTPVWERVLMGRYPHSHAWHQDGKEDLHHVEQALEKLDLSQQAHRLISTLSAGEQQRVAIAMQLAQDTSINFLDEPLNHLDLEQQLHFVKLVRKHTQQQQHNFILVLHDINLAYQCAHQVIFLYGDGRCASGKVKQLMQPEALSDLYNCTITCCIDQHGDKKFFPKSSD
jgi:iron complex transport system ATP-binding protein